MILNNNVWVFGSGNGQNFSDNSRDLFLYCAKKKIAKTIWLTRSNSVQNEIRSRGYICYKFYSTRGIYYALTSRVIIICNSFDDVSFLSYILFPRTKIIGQLWHGTPLKVLENMKFGLIKRIMLSVFLAYVGRDCDFVVTATEKNINIYKKIFRVSENKILISGQPRNDNLVSKNVLKTLKIKSIWYMPTFREYDKDFDFFGKYGFNIKRIDKLLSKYSAVLNIKLHHVNKDLSPKLTKQIQKSKHVNLVTGGDTYEQLSTSYALITDYSSVFFDYLLTRSPIIFTPFDLKEYKKRRNFYYDYDEVTHGAKAMKWKDVEHELEKLFLGLDDWQKERQTTLKMFNKYFDNKSSERVAEKVLSLIQNVE